MLPIILLVVSVPLLAMLFILAARESVRSREQIGAESDD